MTIATIEQATTLAPGLYEVELVRITPAPDNIREDLGDLAELAESIREQGVLEPLLVTTDGILVCGHRRYAAAQLAERTIAPCMVRPMTDAERVAAMLAENLQRTDITPVEEAKGYQTLLTLGEAFTGIEAVAERIGVRPQRVKDRLQLMRLPLAAQIAVRDGELTIGNAMALAKLADHPDDIQSIVDRIAGSKGERYAYHTWERIPVFVEEALQRVKQAQARERAIAKQPKGTKIVSKDWDGTTWSIKAKWRPVHGREDYDTRGGKAVLHEVAAHRKLPCHAVAITRGGKAVECCTKPETHRGEAPPVGQASAAAASQRPERVDYRPIFDATTDARREVERLVIDDPACRGQLLRAVIDGAVNEDMYEDPRGLVEHWPDTDKIEDPEWAVRAFGLMYLGSIDTGGWSPASPFIENPDLGDYYALLEAHGYEMSDGERKLRDAAAADVSTAADDPDEDKGVENEDTGEDEDIA